VYQKQFESLYDELVQLRLVLLNAAPPGQAAADDTDRAASMHNLARYTALRSRDLRPLQHRLVEAGLSSLGRCEPWVLGSIDSVVRAAAALSGRPQEQSAHHGEPDDHGMRRGRALLNERAEMLLGPAPKDRQVRVMVTMPEAAAEDPAFIRTCLEAGMNVMRINTAAGTPDEWRSMIAHLRQAELPTGHTCRVFADLPGPKIRIRSIERRAKPTDGAKLQIGDRLRIVRGDCPAGAGKAVVVSVDHPGLLAGVEQSHAIWFDDGKVGATVERATDDHLEAEVTFTKPGGQRIRVGKGLNVPDSDIQTPALTPSDHVVLRELWSDVDLFGLSFVRSADDVRDMQAASEDLAERTGRPAPGIVLKIETRRGFEKLPELLFELLRFDACGVMLARGDLAVECGFERLAEIQEELLCFCEAAHVPVIWATDVLGSLAKLGRPTRAEITDAAAAQRAECVMLNKGPQILDALRTLCDILSRMQEHQVKKTAMFRSLNIASAATVMR
jgi:pyruvate kinase